MSERVLITFSGARYHDTTKRIVEDGPKFGATRVLVYDDHWLLRQEKHVADTRHLIYPGNRGVNWFCFKPFVILDALRRVEKDDVVFFIDGDTYPVADLSPVFDITARDGIMLFMANGWPRQSTWCKRSCFAIMGMDTPIFHNAHHACARFMGFTHWHKDFLEEWLKFCLIKDCTTFDAVPGYGPELPGFRQHRCEQAILTNLAHRVGVRLYREADDSGECVWPDNGGSGEEDLRKDRDLYPQLFQQVGAASYAPGAEPVDLGQGSTFRNVDEALL